MRPVVVGWLCLLSVLTAHSVTAQLASFEEGNQRYQDGDYAGALERYQDIMESGYESGELYYNIGNAYFKLGDLGRAIVNYERARRLMPGDGDVRANLELARSLTADEITPLPGFWLLRAVRWWVHAVPRSALVLIVALGYLGAGIALMVAILSRRPALTTWAVRTAAALGVLVLVFGINLAVIELGIGQSTDAVVLADEASVQSAPSDDRALQVFTIHEGTTVRVDQRSGDWWEIVLADGKVGWVRSDLLERI
jgi:tetratricopeptide (TPR) repeat protein